MIFGIEATLVLQLLAGCMIIVGFSPNYWDGYVEVSIIDRYLNAFLQSYQK